MSANEFVEHLFRHRAGQITASLARVLGFGQIDLIEEVVQEALYKALALWPYQGVPRNPTAWIIEAAKNAAYDRLRREKVWREKESAVRAVLEGWADHEFASGGGISRDSGGAGFAGEIRDDTLAMMFTCCHPKLSPESQVALTLKVVGGFSASEAARAFLIPKETMAQRIVRAKRTLREAQVSLAIPGPDEIDDRLAPVLQTLYLMFNEGYASWAGETHLRRDLCYEAIRLCALLAGHPVTGRPETHALHALLLLQSSRFDSRLDEAGNLVLLADQDRKQWDRDAITAGTAALNRSASGDRITPYHREAEIAACHALAPSYEETDWPRILACFDALIAANPSPVIRTHRMVARMEAGDLAGAREEERLLEEEASLRDYVPFLVARAELAERRGERVEAAAIFARGIERAHSDPVKRHLQRRWAKLAGPHSG
ncbi:MAG: hypothetical protein HKN20_05230 [Gemmatimonadetes bacterium]|nr:hypothetical protein [Gemmatimonadota bacterium]